MEIECILVDAEDLRMRDDSRRMVEAGPLLVDCSLDDRVSRRIFEPVQNTLNSRALLTLTL